ncbi:MAG: PAS domain-containing protein [Afipia sp.]|nr:PAS domain-containing protein [Afipia sp.]
MLDLLGDANFIRRLIAIAERWHQGGFFIVELPSRTTFWSDGLFTLVDSDRTAFTPDFSSINNYQHPDDRRSPAELETILMEASSYDREFRVITSRGRLRWISCHIEFQTDPDGRPVRKIGMLHDISELHETQRLLATHRERFNALTGALPMLVWSGRPDGHVESLMGWRRLTGQDDRTAEGTAWIERVHPDDRETVCRRWRDAVESGEPYSSDVRVLTADGSYRWLAASARPVRSADGVIIEWIGAAIDIQERRIWPMDPTDSIAITGGQIRAARGLLNWSVSRLSTSAGVASSAIRRLEEFDGVTKGENDLRSSLKNCLRSAGVEFIFPPNGKPGIRPA